MKYLDRTLYAVSWLINLFLILAVFGSMNEVNIKSYFSSDTLYLASIYKDIFIDDTGFKGWYLNAAPNFFPDMFLYFIINYLIPNFKIAYIVFSCVQYFLILFLLNCLIRAIKPDVHIKYLSLVNLTFPVFLMIFLVSGFYIYTYFIISHSFHSGVFINFLLASIFLFKYLHSKKSIYILLGALICLIGTYNDRLFLVLFTFPLIFTLLFNFTLIKNIRLLKVSIFLIVSSFIGLLIYRKTENNEIFYCIGLDQKYMNLENVLSSLKNLINQHLLYIKEFRIQGFIAIVTVLNFFIIPYIVYRFLKKKQAENSNESEIIYFIFIFGSIYLTLFAPVINGYYLGTAHLRYNIFSFWLSIFNISFFIFYLFNSRPIIINGLIYTLGIVYFAFILNLYLKTDIKKGIHDVATYYPKKIELIDEFAKTHDLQYGLSEYWGAKMITMFSKQNLRVYTVASEKLNPWYHVMNRNWYHDYKRGKYNKPVFKFVLLNNMDPYKLQLNFGKAIDSLVYEQETILYVIEDVKYDQEGKPIRVLE